MTTWPNWVDLVVVTVVFTACYKAFARGFFAEVFRLVGVVSVTCLTINYSEETTGYLQPIVGHVNPTVARWLVFWVVFAFLTFIAHLLIRRLTEIVKWERIHWTIQGMAMLLGLARGLWWCAVIMVALTSSGLSYLSQSAGEHSVIGSRWLSQAEQLLDVTATQYPGGLARQGELIPPARTVVEKPKDKGRH